MENLESRRAWQYEFDLDGDKEGWKLYHAVAAAENGNLIVTAQENYATNKYDVQIYMDAMEVDASLYNKVSVRIKPKYLPSKIDGSFASRYIFKIYFATVSSPSFNEQRAMYVDLKTLVPDHEGYYNITFEMSNNAYWQGTISGIRLDPTNQNGVFYFDYIRLSG